MSDSDGIYEVRCPHCNSSSYEICNEDKSDLGLEFIVLLCRCEKCGKHFTVVYKVVQITKKFSLHGEIMENGK